MYRISVTTLEKFRRFMAEASSFDLEADLIKTIKGIFEGNDKTVIGEAYHKIIEGDYIFVKQSGKFLAGQVAFTAEQAAAALEYRSRHPHMIHEVPVSKIYTTLKYQIKVTGRIDGTEGWHLHDAKTKFSTPDLQEYHDSFQWRFYLEMVAANQFYYDLFEVRGFDTLTGNYPFILKDVQFVPHEPYQCIRYPNLTSDCQQLVEEFMDYIEQRNFFHLLKTAEVKAA